MANKADNYFAIIPHWVLFSEISPQAIRLYCVLRTYADNRTMESWPSRTTLAKDLKVDVKTVDRAIKELVELGALDVEKRFHNGEPTTNLYTLISLGSPKNVATPSPADVATTPQESRTNYNHITKTNLNGNKPDGLQVKDLMKIYFDNFTGELEPARPQIAGQLQQALKQIPYEKLELLVRQVAIEGQVVTRNTLVIAQNRLTEKPKQVTPTPPKFDPQEFERPDAVPMPSDFRDMVKKLAMGKMGDE